jgi:hypothetical protein
VGTVALRFTEPLDPTLQPGQFRLGAVQPVSLLVAHGGTEVILQFDPAPGGEGMLAWEGVRDAEGTPVGIAATAVRFEHGEAGTLIVEAWSIVDPYTVRLVFSEALDPSDAADPSNYRLHPSGSIVRLDHDPARPAEVVVRVEGRRLGATGLETSLEVIRMQSAGGNRLAPEGHRLLLAEAAADLTGVYVFPNPHRAEVHAAHVTIAGLPTEATIHVLSVQGTLVRRIEARSATGGVRWDLTDGNGQAIPSGVYLVRVEAPGEEAVLRKVAVIR